MPVSPTVTLSASEAGAVAMSIEMKLRCNARIFKLWSGKGGKVELKERAILDEPGTRRFCFDRQLEVPIYSLLRCYQQDKVSNPVNEKKYRLRYRFPKTLIVRESFFLPLPILPNQSIYNVRSRMVWIAVQRPKVRNIRSWDILQ